MKECEKHLEKLPLKPERNYPSAQVAEEMGFRAGWKDALEWVLNEYSIDIDEAYKHFPHIKEELNNG